MCEISGSEADGRKTDASEPGKKAACGSGEKNGSGYLLLEEEEVRLWVMCYPKAR